jgi:hypothetical protein
MLLSVKAIIFITDTGFANPTGFSTEHLSLHVFKSTTFSVESFCQFQVFWIIFVHPQPFRFCKAYMDSTQHEQSNCNFRAIYHNAVPNVSSPKVCLFKRIFFVEDVFLSTSNSEWSFRTSHAAFICTFNGVAVWNTCANCWQTVRHYVGLLIY